MIEEITGKIIGGKYRLLSLLGEGAMGVVYRAEQLDTEGSPLREVALKMIQPGLSLDTAFSKRFLREVRMTAKLRSPNTVVMHDSGQSEEEQLYYVMELIRGPTLKQILQQHGTLGVKRVVNIVGQVCEALTEAHTLPDPIVHRDLKPSNLFIEERSGQDWVKVGDFGIAKTLGEETSGLTLTGQSPGTPRYMAPEQCMGKPVDAQTDLYALGIMMYEMLAGKPPFSNDEGPVALIYQHLENPPPPLSPSIPIGIRELVTQLLAKDPKERPVDALSVRNALKSALAGTTERKLKKSLGAVDADTEPLMATVRQPEIQAQHDATAIAPEPEVINGPRRETPPKRKMRWHFIWLGCLMVALMMLVELPVTNLGIGCSPANWAGKWDTTYAKMMLDVSGESVTGTYNNGIYNIKGKLSQDACILTGTWSHPVDGRSGSLKFTLTGAGFLGVWTEGSRPMEKGTDWSGTRESAKPNN